MKDRTVMLNNGSNRFSCYRTWDEVSDEWYRRSGERLTRQGVCHVAMVAMTKIRRMIEADPVLADELGAFDHQDGDESIGGRHGMR